jgi:hypothetical protein
VNIRRDLMLIGLIMGVPAIGSAQVLQRPERAAAPTAESEAWHRLTFSANTLGTYDDNVLAEQASSVDPTVPPVSGYTSYADGSLRFDRGKGTQSLGASGRAYVNTFYSVGLTPVYGGDVAANFGTGLGRRHRLDLSQHARNEPFYAMGGYSGLRQAVDPATLPDGDPLNGLTQKRSWSAGSRLGLSSQWSPRNSVAMSAGYDIREFYDDVGDSRRAYASLSYNRNVGRRSSWRVLYDHADTNFLELNGWIPSVTHGVEGGVRLERRFSPTRRLIVSFGGGGVHLRTRDRFTEEEFAAAAPTAYGLIRLDWARTWSLSADYRRSVGTLDGLSSEMFATDAALARLGGFVARRAEMVFSMAYAEGRTTGRGTAAFDTYTGTSQLRRELIRDWSVVASHSYYRYFLRDVKPTIGSLPPQLNRHAIRIGLSVNLPVTSSRTDIDRNGRD